MRLAGLSKKNYSISSEAENSVVDPSKVGRAGDFLLHIKPHTFGAHGSSRVSWFSTQCSNTYNGQILYDTKPVFV